MSQAPAAGPLAGIRVLELGSSVAGPFCGRLLADFGAEVIKVEVAEGDAVRSMGKRLGGKSLYAASIFRNKRLVSIDLKTARGLERLLTANKLVNSSITVINKPGGGQNLAFTYVSQRPGDGHTLCVFGGALLTNQIRGSSRLTHSDFTPIAALINDYTVFAVSAASPIKNGTDLIERLKQDPKSVTIGFAQIGGASPLAAARFNQAIGGNAKDLKGVAFGGAASTITSLLGGHIDLATMAASNARVHVAAGTMRVVGAAAPRRLGGALADVPTWKEQGVDLVFGTWRALASGRMRMMPPDSTATNWCTDSSARKAS